MRKYAILKKPLKRDSDDYIFKIMMYQTDKEYYLFEYFSPDAIQCSADRLYESLEDLYDDWNDYIDENGWIEIEDPLPGCQHDAVIPVRVKGRDIGKPQWGKYETLIDGKWIDLNE